MKRFFRYLFKTVSVLALVLFVAIAFLHWYQPDVQPVVFPAPKPVSGAALFYNQAFASMPKLSDADKKLFNTKEALDAQAATELVTKWDPALRLISQGSAQTECEWGLNLSLGPALPTPHLLKGLEISQVLGVRARLHLLEGNASAATDDLLLIFRLSRHLGQPPLLIGKLVTMSANNVAIFMAARNLQKFDSVSLQKLSEGIAALPSSPSMSQAVTEDNKSIAGYLRNILAKNKAKSEFATICSYDSEDQWIIKISSASPTICLYMVERFEQRSQELDKLMELPYAEGNPKVAAFEKDISKKWQMDIFSKLVFPAVFGCHLKEAQSETMWAILRTAIDSQLHNPADVRTQLAKLRDPYDGSPIQMQDVQGGVEITLKSEEGRKPVTLTVGIRGN